MPLNLSGDIAGLGKIVQIVRAVDTTQRSTTEITYQDAGISVSISPLSSTSNIIVIWTFGIKLPAGTSAFSRGRARIVDNSGSPISGASGVIYGINAQNPQFNSSINLIGWDEPGTTSSITYTAQHLAVDIGTTSLIANTESAGQMFAIEVAA